MSGEITVDGKSLSEYLKELEDEQKREDAQNLYDSFTKIPKYKRPLKQFEQTKVRSKPGRHLSREEIMITKGVESMGPVPRAHKLIWILIKETPAEGLSASEIYSKAGYGRGQLTQISSVLSNVYKKLGPERHNIIARSRENQQYRYYLTENAVGVSYENALKLFSNKKTQKKQKDTTPAQIQQREEQSQTKTQSQDHNINVNINFKVNLSLGFSKQ